MRGGRSRPRRCVDWVRCVWVLRCVVWGQVHLPRVPPYMKPVKLRHLLSQFGTLGRVYMKPEGEARACCSGVHPWGCTPGRARCLRELSHPTAAVGKAPGW
jgi:hypothetical protein